MFQDSTCWTICNIQREGSPQAWKALCQLKTVTSNCSCNTHLVLVRMVRITQPPMRKLEQHQQFDMTVVNELLSGFADIVAMGRNLILLLIQSIIRCANDINIRPPWKLEVGPECPLCLHILVACLALLGMYFMYSCELVHYTFYGA